MFIYKIKYTILLILRRVFFGCGAHFRNRDNKIVLIKPGGKKIVNPKIKNLKVEYSKYAKNNLVEINAPFVTKNTKIVFDGSNNTVKIGSKCDIRSLNILLGQKSNIIIGDGLTSEGTSLTTFSTDSRSIVIGDDCMFSYQVLIRVSDNHAIYDKNTKKLLNPEQDTIIGSHVWLCAKSMLTKGSVVPNDCVVGAGSIVTKKFSEPNCVIAGIPAKVVKKGINWDRRFPHQWEPTTGLSDF